MNTDNIKGYHLHAYYDDEDSRARAAQLRADVKKKFNIRVTPLIDEPDMDDPHQRPMFIAFFTPEDYSQFVPWVMVNQNQLKMMIHPLTGEDREDHLERAMWFGEVLPINAAAL